MVKGKNEFLIGETIPPYFIDDITDLQNTALLLNLLNKGDVFDAPVTPFKGDLLELNPPVDGRIYYGFQYTGKRWRKKGYDSLMWHWHHEAGSFGIIKRPFDPSTNTLAQLL